MKDTKWNEEKIQQLIEMYKSKILSTTEMSKKLGFTKNAIVGKIHRLRAKNLIPALNEEIQSETIEKRTNIQFGDYKLAELSKYGMCVWPEGEEDFVFCGKPVVHNESYCSEHFSLVYLENKKATKKKTNLYTRADMEEDEDILDTEETS